MIALDHLESVTGNFIQGSQISFEARPIWEALQEKSGKYISTRMPKHDLSFAWVLHKEESVGELLLFFWLRRRKIYPT